MNSLQSNFYIGSNLKINNSCSSSSKLYGALIQISNIIAYLAINAPIASMLIISTIIAVILSASSIKYISLYEGGLMSTLE